MGVAGLVGAGEVAHDQLDGGGQGTEGGEFGRLHAEAVHAGVELDGAGGARVVAEPGVGLGGAVEDRAEAVGLVEAGGVFFRVAAEDGGGGVGAEGMAQGRAPGGQGGGEGSDGGGGTGRFQ